MKKKVMMGILLVLTFSIVACGSNTKKTESSNLATAIASWQKQYDLGMQYLEDGDYEQAIVAFTAAIEIDPKQAMLYVARADAYVEWGDSESSETAVEKYRLALADYEKALEIQLDDEVQQKLDAVNKKINFLTNETVRLSGYNASNEIIWWYDCTYDVDGRQTSVTSYDADGNEQKYIEILYDVDGKVIQSYNHRPESGKLFKKELEYDAQGFLTRENYFDENDNPVGYSLITCDESGQVIKDVEYSMSGETDVYDELVYDESGNVTYVYSYWNEDPENPTYREELYDYQNNNIETRYYYADGWLSETIQREFDEKGRPVKETVYRTGEDN